MPTRSPITKEPYGECVSLAMFNHGCGVRVVRVAHAKTHETQNRQRTKVEDGSRVDVFGATLGSMPTKTRKYDQCNLFEELYSICCVFSPTLTIESQSKDRCSHSVDISHRVLGSDVEVSAKLPRIHRNILERASSNEPVPRIGRVQVHILKHSPNSPRPSFTPHTRYQTVDTVRHTLERATPLFVSRYTPPF